MIRILGVSIVLAAAWLVYSTLFGRPLREKDLLQRVAFELYWDDPDMAARGGIASGALWDVWSTRFTDDSPQRADRVATRKRRLLALLRSYPPAQPGTRERLSRDVVEWYLDSEVRGEPFRHHDYLVESYGGVQASVLEILTELHPLDTVRGAEAYLTRLHAVPRKIDGILAGLRHRAARGIVAPRWSLEKVATEIERFVSAPPADDTLCAAFARRTERTDGLSAERRAELRALCERAVATDVVPAYRRLLAEVRMLAERSPAGDGVWRLPDGGRYYAHLLRRHTTLDLSANEIHAIGLREVERASRDLDAALRRLGLSEGTPAGRMRRLAEQPDRTFPPGEEGRGQMLRAYDSLARAARAGSAPLFVAVPRGEIDVRPVPAWAEGTSDAAHGAVRGTRMTLFVNTRAPERTPRHSVATLVFHETFPGHFVQRRIQRSLRGAPMIRRVLPLYAFADGWAMYAERLGWEAGLTRDPLDDVGRLQSELWRAARLVVDTGLHERRWSRERAADYMAAVTGLPSGQVEAEVERYALQPAQACAYMIGMLEFLSLREEARQRLGAAFRLPEFHAALLDEGPMPLPFLREQIRVWIDERRGRGPASPEVDRVAARAPAGGVSTRAD